jgi:hypothetical protein
MANKERQETERKLERLIIKGDIVSLKGVHIRVCPVGEPKILDFRHEGDYDGWMKREAFDNFLNSLPEEAPKDANAYVIGKSQSQEDPNAALARHLADEAAPYEAGLIGDYQEYYRKTTKAKEMASYRNQKFCYVPVQFYRIIGKKRKLKRD